LENDQLFHELVTNPADFVRAEATRDQFRKCIAAIVGDLIVDLNAEVDEYGDDFDYRDKLRDSEWLKSLNKAILKDYLKQINRGRIQSFSDEWEKESGEASAKEAVGAERPATAKHEEP